jgi:hypothetical protein
MRTTFRPFSGLATQVTLLVCSIGLHLCCAASSSCIRYPVIIDWTRRKGRFAWPPGKPREMLEAFRPVYTGRQYVCVLRSLQARLHGQAICARARSLQARLHGQAICACARSLQARLHGQAICARARSLQARLHGQAICACARSLQARLHGQAICACAGAFRPVYTGRQYVRVLGAFSPVYTGKCLFVLKRQAHTSF